MKKLSIFPLFIALMLLLAVPFASANKTFTDVDNDFWAINEINKLSSKKIINGYEDNSFRPNNDVTRADAAIMIARALKLDTENIQAITYKDVDSNHYAYKAIAAVFEAGIMQGSNNNFQPEKGLTRAEMAVVLTNAFDLTATSENTFKDVAKDHFAFDAIHYLLAHEITTGYPDKTFKPEKTTSRAEFATLLVKALATDNHVSKPKPEQNAEMAALLAEIQENELNLESYEFEGGANIGLTLPEMGEDLDFETGLIFEALKNIQVNMSGAYVKDPMQLEMLLELVISKELGLAFELPIIMTNDEIYFKLPNSDLLGLPEELNDKYIYMNLNELAEMSPEDAAALDMELQFELSKMVNEIVTKHLSGFYSHVDVDSVEYTAHKDAQKAIKFEISNETIEPFIQILFEDIMPEMLELMQDPEYAAAFGLTAEDLELLVGADLSLDFESKEFKEMLQQLQEALTIHDLSSHIFINKNNVATDHLFNVDVDVTLEGETIGINVGSNLTKSKINEKVSFKQPIPAKEDTITLDELMEYLFELDEDYEFDLDELQ